MTSQEIKALTGQYIMNTYGRFPVAIDHGEGATLYDPEGNAYIDFTSGIGVSDLGCGNQPWADAIAAQAKKLGHVRHLTGARQEYDHPAIQKLRQGEPVSDRELRRALAAFKEGITLGER